MAGHQQGPSASEGPHSSLLQELWRTKAWRLFPLLLIYLSGLTVLIPHVPGIMTDYFAERRAGHELHCDGLPPDARAVDATACRDAHADVVLWSSWTSFFSNSFVSIVLTPLFGHWSDLHGRKPFFLLAQAFACVPLAIVLLHLTMDLPLLWYYVTQVFVSSLSSVTICLAFLADLLPQRHRAPAFGTVMATFSVAVFIGPAVGAALDPITAALCALGTVGVVAAYTLVLLPESLSQDAKAAARARHSHRHDTDPSQQAAPPSVVATALASTLRASRILLRSPLFKRLTVVMMLTGVVSEGVQDLLLQYLKLTLNFGVADVSHIFMMFGACGLVVQTVILGTALSWFGEQRVLVASLAASCVQQLVLALAGAKWVVFLGIGVGSLGSMVFPTISSIKSNNSQEHEQGSVQGALYGARALAAGTGPLIFAFLFAAFTKTDSPLPYFPGAPLLFGAALMLVAMAVAATLSSAAAASGGSLERSAQHGGERGGRQGSAGLDEEALLEKLPPSRPDSAFGAGEEGGEAGWPAERELHAAGRELQPAVERRSSSRRLREEPGAGSGGSAAAVAVAVALEDGRLSAERVRRLG